jgi:hypothetical protein
MLPDYSIASWHKLGKRVAVLIICMSLGGCGGCGTSKRAKIRTRTTLFKADVAVREYRLANQKLPENAEGQKLIGQLRDDWNKVLRYRRLDAENFEVVSAGPDGVFETDDDLIQP